MNIGINLLYINTRFVGGSVICAINLVNELSKIDKVNKYIIYINKNSRDLPFLLGDNFTLKVIPFHNSNIFVRYFWEQLIFPFYLLKDKLDILHSPGYVGPLISGKKHIVSILDVNYKGHSNNMSLFKRLSFGLMVNLTSKIAEHIITISEFSKREIVTALNVAPDNVTVVLLSGSRDDLNDAFILKEKIKNIYNINSDYIIAFGSPSGHKNINRLISSFKKINEKDPGLMLVLVGYQHKNVSLQELISEKGLEEKVIFTGFVPDEHVLPLISESKVFVFPSLYEGFGIPILDAQSAKVPIASSKLGSLPEVGGEGAIYFDPLDEIDMSNAIRKILENRDLAMSLIQKGSNNRAMFSWKKTAEETLSCYNKYGAI